ncbi:hypothetical protein BC830DRAFT_1240618 [Chytriomyces sp. MP71]|nr:hypothetical protein BC830DRAFT_1240618 [Chytriomyces sp. MP71]
MSFSQHHGFSIMVCLEGTPVQSSVCRPLVHGGDGCSRAIDCQRYTQRAGKIGSNSSLNQRVIVSNDFDLSNPYLVRIASTIERKKEIDSETTLSMALKNQSFFDNLLGTSTATPAPAAPATLQTVLGIPGPPFFLHDLQPAKLLLHLRPVRKVRHTVSQPRPPKSTDPPRAQRLSTSYTDTTSNSCNAIVTGNSSS